MDGKDWVPIWASGDIISIIIISIIIIVHCYYYCYYNCILLIHVPEIYYHLQNNPQKETKILQHIITLYKW